MESENIIAQRIKKLDWLRERGVDPYPRNFQRSHTIQQLRDNFEEGKRVAVAGRLIARREHGKACFCDIRDQGDRVQLYFKSNVIGDDQYAIFRECDIGDFFGVEGELFKTRSGEVTVKVERFELLSKSLRPLPEKWHGLKDIQTRYRQRYLDLIANESVKNVFMVRSKLISAIRRLLDAQGYIEVETPMMHTIPGGAAGKPFTTFHNELDMELYLRIAPELYLKRLLVGGFEKIYEINRSFRNEGVSTRHNPEFTMLEIYAAYEDYETMMKLCQDIVVHCVKETTGGTAISLDGKAVDLARPWPRYSFADIVRDRFAITPEDDVAAMVKKLQKKGWELKEEKLSRMQIVRIIEDFLQEEQGAAPVFLTDYFSILCPLAKTKKDNPLLSERFELFMGGMEVANAYSELNDPIEQRRRFEQELAVDADRKAVDDDYVIALEHGMPPAGGLGIGIDRLVMVLLQQPSIRDVLLFPLLKPDGGASTSEEA